MESRDLHVHIHLDSLNVNVSHTVAADAAVTALFHAIKEEIATMSNTVQEALDALTEEVAQEESVNQSAITLIQGFAAQLAAAVSAAQAAGATAAQLAAFDVLGKTLTDGQQALAAAVTANTPAAPPAAAPAAPTA